MKTMSRILSMVIVVGLIAAIPASTQILTGERVATSEESNLPMLILINRLELSEDQMDALDDILTGLIGEKDSINEMTADLEQAMIEFDGTGEELDVMLATFREDQVAAAEALRESIGGSLDAVRDLLSINQGLVLQEVFPQLMGGILMGADQASAHRMDSRMMPTAEMGRGRGMSQQSPRGRKMPGQRGSYEENCSGDEALFGRTQETFGERMDVRTRVDADTMMSQRFGQTGNDETASEQMLGRMGQIAVQAPTKMNDRMAGRTREDIETMMAQRLGQDVDDAAMSEQMRDRLEQLGNRFPEGMIERFGEAIGRFDAQMDHDLSPRNIVGRGDLRHPGASSFLMQRGGVVQTEDRDLFGLLEQIERVLELKLEAME